MSTGNGDGEASSTAVVEDDIKFEETFLQQQDELMAMESILGSEVFTASLAEVTNDQKQQGGSLSSGKILIELTLPDKKYLVLDKSTKEETFVTHLPPITLWFTLPRGYPVKDPPLFTLSSTWLGALELTDKYAFRERDVLTSSGHNSNVGVPRKKTKATRSSSTGNCVDQSQSSQNGADVAKNNSEAAETEEDKQARSTSSSSNNTSDSNNGGRGGLSSRNNSVEQEQQPSSSTSHQCNNEAGNSGVKSGPLDTSVSKHGRRGSGKHVPSTSSHGIVPDRRAVCEAFEVIRSKGSLLNYLREYSEEKEETEFNESVHLCSVCFCDKMGTEFMRLRCGHAFCNDCVSVCYITHIKEGNVDSVKCLGVECSEVPTYSKVKSAVGDELFERYDSILLQRALENMDDTTYCPRTQCGKPVILDNSSERLASCSACSYRFCSKCKMVYHGVEPCRFKADERKQLFDKYTSGTAAEKTLLEKTYGKVQLKQLVETTLSEKWVAKQSKPCPHCKSPIDKFEGCNKVTCGKCNSYFCWKCLAILDRTNPYFHFNDPQSACFNDLFENGNDSEDEDDDGGFRVWLGGDDSESEYSDDSYYPDLYDSDSDFYNHL